VLTEPRPEVAVRRTTFRFNVEFRSDDPRATCTELVAAIEQMTGVIRAVSGPFSERCPLSEFQVEIEFAGEKQAHALYERISRSIDQRRDSRLTYRSFSLTDVFGP
jgi:hypothetical protein